MTASPSLSDFTFPPHYSFPPFFTLQPNPQTRASQLASWSSLILSYCKANRKFLLQFNSEILASPLFTNASIARKLSSRDARAVLDWMASPEGGRRIEWLGGKGSKPGQETACFVYWRRPEEWAWLIYGWVDQTGQKGTVLTLYEITEGDASRGQEFFEMDAEVLRRSLQVLVQNGKAQIFGQEDSLGVKFF